MLNIPALLKEIEDEINFLIDVDVDDYGRSKALICPKDVEYLDTLNGVYEALKLLEEQHAKRSRT